ncbi:MAG: rRNA maturation RNase YbeY [Thermomicrobiales bacterium]
MSEVRFRLDLDVDLQTTLPSNFQVANVHRIVEAVLAAEAATGGWEIAIVLADDLELQRLHRDYLDDDTPTDIMTFPNSGGEEWSGFAESARGGDIAISVDRAADQAADYGWDTTAEIHFLVAHGVLHLLGWEDATSHQRATMLDRQRAILATLEA